MERPFIYLMAETREKLIEQRRKRFRVVGKGLQKRRSENRPAPECDENKNKEIDASRVVHERKVV